MKIHHLHMQTMRLQIFSDTVLLGFSRNSSFQYIAKCDVLRYRSIIEVLMILMTINETSIEFGNNFITKT